MVRLIPYGRVGSQIAFTISGGTFDGKKILFEMSEETLSSKGFLDSHIDLDNFFITFSQTQIDVPDRVLKRLEKFIAG